MPRLTTAMPTQQQRPMRMGLPPVRTSLTRLVLKPIAAIAMTMKNLESSLMGAVTAAGMSVILPAPLSDINGAIALGCLSYLVILSGGIVSNKLRGVGRTLKEFSLPISMSFRLFGALLSGMLVTELVYYYLALSFVLPVIVGVLFTVLHALIQTYVLTMLTTLFYGEVSEPYVRKPKKQRKKKGAPETEPAA